MTNSPTNKPAPKLFDRSRTLLVTSIEAGIDVAVIALWLGHESIATTSIYLHADLTIKRTALEHTRQPDTPVGDYHPDDPLLASLQAL